MIRLLVKQRRNSLGVHLRAGVQVPSSQVLLLPVLRQKVPSRFRSPQPFALHEGPTQALLAASSGHVWGVPGCPLTQGVNTVPAALQLPVVQRGGGAPQAPPWQIWPAAQAASWN